MGAVTRVAATFLVAQAVASGVAWACKCEGGAYDPVAVRDASGQVFVGEVLDGPRGGCGGSDTVRHTLLVTEAFKGVEVGDEVELSTAADGAACGVAFGIGESWLVYTNDGTYGLCDPGGIAADHGDEIATLRAAE